VTRDGKLGVVRGEGPGERSQVKRRKSKVSTGPLERAILSGEPLREAEPLTTLDLRHLTFD
jgi:hypothetical protein